VINPELHLNSIKIDLNSNRLPYYRKTCSKLSDSEIYPNCAFPHFPTYFFPFHQTRSTEGGRSIFVFFIHRTAALRLSCVVHCVSSLIDIYSLPVHARVHLYLLPQSCTMARPIAFGAGKRTRVVSQCCNRWECQCSPLPM